MRIDDLIPDEPSYSLAFYEAQAASQDPFTRRTGEMILQLVGQIRDDSAPITFFAFVQDDLLLINSTVGAFHVWVDAFDYSPLVDGRPQYHYRVEHRVDRRLTDEFRGVRSEDVVSYIRQRCEPEG